MTASREAPVGRPSTRNACAWWSPTTRCCGQAGDGEDLLRTVGAHQPDVAVIDVRMPPTYTDEGPQTARRTRAEHPATAVLVLSAYVDAFTDAVERVAHGGSVLDPEVLALMAEGRSNGAMAHTLVVTERAVEKHVSGIFSKLGPPQAASDHRRVLAVLAFLRSDA